MVKSLFPTADSKLNYSLEIWYLKIFTIICSWQKKGLKKSSLDAMGFELMTLQYRCSALTELSGQLGGAYFVISYV